MKATYADNDYFWVFQLIGNDKLLFEANESIVPESDSQWEDGMVFFR